jgi:hypothetical protein
MHIGAVIGRLPQHTLQQNASVTTEEGGSGSDCSNGQLVACFDIGSSVMASNSPSLLWSSVATGFGDITSSTVDVTRARYY